MSASHALDGGEIVNMAAGEGKSWLFMVDAVRQAVRGDVDAVHVITTRGNLADREFERYQELLTPLGFDVHRMDSDNPPPDPVPGRPTIYIGTSQDVGFTLAAHRPGARPERHRPASTPGSTRSTRRSCYSNSQYILSDGVQGTASEAITESVKAAARLIRDGLASGELTAAHFGRSRGPGRRQGGADPRGTGQGGGHAGRRGG